MIPARAERGSGVGQARRCPFSAPPLKRGRGEERTNPNSMTVDSRDSRLANPKRSERSLSPAVAMVVHLRDAVIAVPAGRGEVALGKIGTVRGGAGDSGRGWEGEGKGTKRGRGTPRVERGANEASEGMRRVESQHLLREECLSIALSLGNPLGEGLQLDALPFPLGADPANLPRLPAHPTPESSSLALHTLSSYTLSNSPCQPTSHSPSTKRPPRIILPFQHDNLDRIIHIQPPENLHQGILHLAREGIARVGTVEGDDGDARVGEVPGYEDAGEGRVEGC